MYPSMGEQLQYAKRDSDAFALEYHRRRAANAIRTDLESYLGEYRFQIHRYDYELIYSDGHLRDIHEGESLIDKTQRAIEKRLVFRKSFSREVAEHKGIAYLDKTLQNAKLGDIILWASPPGSKEDGYGKYGYIFKGVIDRSDGHGNHIRMSALRIDREELDAYNGVINETIGAPIFFRNTEDFLANPFVLHSVRKDPEMVILEKFGQKLDVGNRFDFSMQILSPLVKEFIRAVKLGLPKDELRKIFYSIENLALQIKENTLPMDYRTLVRTMLLDAPGLIAQFGSHRAPFAAGSCGGTEDESNNILDQDNFIKKLLGEDDDRDEYGLLKYKCGMCGELHRRHPHEIQKICSTLMVQMEKC